MLCTVIDTHSLALVRESVLSRSSFAAVNWSCELSHIRNNNLSIYTLSLSHSPLIYVSLSSSCTGHVFYVQQRNDQDTFCQGYPRVYIVIWSTQLLDWHDYWSYINLTVNWLESNCKLSDWLESNCELSDWLESNCELSDWLESNCELS